MAKHRIVRTIDVFAAIDIGKLVGNTKANCKVHTELTGSRPVDSFLCNLLCNCFAEST